MPSLGQISFLAKELQCTSGEIVGKLNTDIRFLIGTCADIINEECKHAENGNAAHDKKREEMAEQLVFALVDMDMQLQNKSA